MGIVLLRVFGHFEKGIFLQLCRHMEILKIEKEKYLFRIGDPDEYMYVIQDGQINLYISEEEREVNIFGLLQCALFSLQVTIISSVTLCLVCPYLSTYRPECCSLSSGGFL